VKKKTTKVRKKKKNWMTQKKRMLSMSLLSNQPRLHQCMLEARELARARIK